MSGYNRVILIGNLTRDPELRYTAQGTAVCTLRLGVTMKSRERENTVFVDVTAWERVAENCNEYLKKGRPVLIEGRLKLDEWEDRESGQKRSKLSVVANVVQFLGGRDDRHDGAPRGAERQARPDTRGEYRPQSSDEFGDNLPF